MNGEMKRSKIKNSKSRNGKSNRTLAERDKALVWHPFTQEHTAAPRLPVSHGRGPWLFDTDNNAYLDLVSSWWVNLFGHACAPIAQSIAGQANRLEHVLFAGCTHEPAVQLCEALSAVLPTQLHKFFFSDNGSTAVEVALKMAHQYWRNAHGQQRKLFIGFEGGYHGDTFGAMSVGAHCGYHDQFRSLFFESVAVPFPDIWWDDADVQAKEQAALASLEAALSQHAGQVAAMIIEPLVQGAAGMRMCRPQFVARACALARANDTLVIFDEVMTGFGRTGTRFAFEQTGVVPDFLCVSKGITGGFLPLALTITGDPIYEAFLSEQAERAFSHGHSYTANPLACAAAVAAMALLESDETSHALQVLPQCHYEGLQQLQQEVPTIRHPRVTGTVAAFDLPASYPQAAGQLHQRFLEKGLLIRPIGQTVYLLPPYVISQAQLQAAYETIGQVLTQGEG
ncbi:adenosylmethionine-8-amino-7-oxononanoate aminotransferase [Advenella mimigardefordensis DPN7]|uniref:Adenosylmethionine-8-amino-7-oxononanoate aminotransferase n=2 Tax=Advenella mimigardefordensis TaxID=302406 RepID=W0PD48_ADVMD|nr:adenosylmethionine-8-amino-7-oxononanoate aminotransferase [Advenella mimigardefordensis DPN7]